MPVNGKQKGGAFERKISKVLSLLVSKGTKTDLYWRSAMSGGRATAQRARGVDVRQAGDITAVAAEGHVLTDKYYIECKAVRDLNVLAFLLSNSGKLAKFWKVACIEAAHYKRQPMIIAKSNNCPILVITYPEGLSEYTSPQLYSPARNCDISFLSDMVSGVPEAVAALKRKKP